MTDSAPNNSAEIPDFPRIQPEKNKSRPTLRDFFAVHAPITMAEAQKTLDDEGAGFVSYGKIYKRLAQMQLAYADAMLQERQTYGK